MTHGEQQPGHLPEDAVPEEIVDPAAGGAPAGTGAPPGEPGSEELTVEDILAAAPAAGEEAEAGATADPEPADETERSYLDDLRRLTAEYANYRKRTETNAELDKQRAVAAAVAGLLPVLDDLDRADQHGDLEEGSAFATIAQKLRGTMERMGLIVFGEKGESFDPQIHEAIAQVPVPGTESATVLDVIERGYRIGEVELRPAKVAVAVATDG